jgi:hypothetical protein
MPRTPHWQRGERLAFAVDLFMLALILVNLGWILFDGLYASHFVRDAFLRWWPAFVEAYDPVHANFSFYDLFFVGAFVAELLIRWAIAAVRGTYHKWWFYPFIHWYDTLGCIPVGSFRFLRVFRIVSIGFRLQRNQVIDLTRTYVFRQARKYYRVLVEEISDRVVLNVLDGVRDEVRQGSPLTDAILRDVVAPRKAEIAAWLGDRVRATVATHYAGYRPDLRDYVDHRIAEAVRGNREVSTLQAIPLLGPSVRQTLERAVADIVFQVLDGLVRDLSSDRSRIVLEETSGMVLDALLFDEEDQVLEKTIRDMLTESIDRIADEVRVQQWKEREAQESAVRERAKRIAALRNARRRGGHTPKPFP